jgi:hypothetical protein
MILHRRAIGNHHSTGFIAVKTVYCSPDQPRPGNGHNSKAESRLSIADLKEKITQSENNVFGVEDGAVFTAEFICLACRRFVPCGDSAPYGGYTFDGAGLTKADAAGHHLFHTDLTVDFFIAGEFGDAGKH